MWPYLIAGAILMILTLRKKTLDMIFEEVAREFQLRPGVLESFAEHESRFEPDAIGDGGRSRGLLQIWEPTARALGITNFDLLFDPRTNITTGAKLLKDQKRRGFDGLDSIAVYNAGAARKNAAGLYVNSKGDTGVDGYVKKVSALMRTRGIYPEKESLFL